MKRVMVVIEFDSNDNAEVVFTKEDFEDRNV